MATRWGICGTGVISNDFCAAISSHPAEEHQIVAVAARDLNRAKTFAAKFEIPTAYGSYQELVQDPNIDIVYIGTIHTTHTSISLLCLNAGKPVLCEKPMCLTIDDVKEVLSLAKEKNLFFMEAVWSRCFPLYDEIRRQLDGGHMGKPLVVMASFVLPILDIARVGEKRLGGGGLMDIGSYTVQAANLVFKEMPEKITVEGALSEEGVDSCACIILRYSDNRMASLVYHTQAMIENTDVPLPERAKKLDSNTFTIIGTKGQIRVDSPFWCPTKMSGPSGIKEFPLPKMKYPVNLINSEGLYYEAGCVGECLKKGLKECPKMTHTDSEIIHTIMADILKQLGVDYTGVAANI
ncbi:trans-1,2-dihydrobenzene-1,2-diol dehydrogenase-like [Gigantopelta aegis]|uniref:trans-1,2-dihydrobenzene-1,2-diol dehydrogenase-like n=1 Tax=Gigantopelta aegis TaxID=1735272 RepID=UPI001B88DC5F|nr:trans-1,2-dihydrobenzene-1,2-diol dehydrogenase-like [Gigantopelta aegis]